MLRQKDMSPQSDIFAPVGQPASYGTKDAQNLQKVNLRLENNPSSTFYKDEGGKSNFLTASCIVAVDEDKSSFPIGNLKISPRLVYESGGEIEDEDEIFNVLNVEPKTITSTNEVFTVNFRIEKVSRRKDGKRFRLRFDVNQQRSQLLDYVSAENLKPVETHPVIVLSKRKSHSNPTQTSSPEVSFTKSETRDGENSIRRKMQSMKIEKSNAGSDPAACRKRRMDRHQNSQSNKSAALPRDFLLKLVENMKSLEATVSQLSDRVQNLERRVAHQQPPTSNRGCHSPTTYTRGNRVHSLMFDEGMNDYVSVSNGNGNSHYISNSLDSTNGMKRNGSSTQELYEFLSTSNFA